MFMMQPRAPKSLMISGEMGRVPIASKYCLLVVWWWWLNVGCGCHASKSVCVYHAVKPSSHQFHHPRNPPPHKDARTCQKTGMSCMALATKQYASWPGNAKALKNAEQKTATG